MKEVFAALPHRFYLHPHFTDSPRVTGFLPSFTGFYRENFYCYCICPSLHGLIGEVPSLTLFHLVSLVIL